ncbi:potassium-transporting ATPase subunit KdpA [Erwinia sp. E_sp_B04_7]|uniref:potassium-transporting ATPase subunit KdpA n=1 Tax=unclassified Erwinia TaxID=2622719 RepID=UPI0030CC075F
MAAEAFLLLACFMIVLLALAKPLGNYMTGMVLDQALPGTRGIEKILGRLCGVSAEEMNWRHYLFAILSFNGTGLIFLFLILRFQDLLPLNPQGLPGLSWHLALNTAISFVANTNWQSYAGETTISYFSETLGLAVQNFLSAASGMAILFALIRGFSRHTTDKLGNAWRDLLRITLFVLLPLSLIMAVYLVSQGVIQNFSPYVTLTTLEGVQQTLPMGPVASQEAIKMLGTNGGGLFNANSAHPFENPTAWTNFIQMLAIFLIPAALCFTFGNVVRDRRQGHTLLWAMSMMFLLAAAIVMWAELKGNPHFTLLGADSAINMEGKESRFGILNSSLFAVITTAASCGAVNAMHDSFTALGGMIPLWLMQLGEVVFGGVGAGLYGMLMNVLLAVFIAGLMIGRTPEYLGKKIGVREMKMAALYILITPSLVLIGTALALMTEAGRAGIFNPGPHGFSEALYALSSAANNNGSAFGGLSANTPFWNLLLGAAMLLGRFLPFLPLMMMAGSLASRKTQPATPGTLPAHGPLFVSLIIGVVLLVGALTFIPALALGPVIEHLQMFGH